MRSKCIGYPRRGPANNDVIVDVFVCLMKLRHNLWNIFLSSSRDVQKSRLGLVKFVRGRNGEFLDKLIVKSKVLSVHRSVMIWIRHGVRR